MAERAHPQDVGFKVGSGYYEGFLQRHVIANYYIKPTDCVVDIPCGVGWGTSSLDGKRIYGIDIDEGAVNYANLHYRQEHITFHMGDMCGEWTNFLPGSGVDVVVCLDGLEHITKYCAERFLRNALTLVNKKGTIIISTPTKRAKHSGNPFHQHEYEVLELTSLLTDCGWSVVDYCLKPGHETPIFFIIGRKDADN